MIKKLTIKTKDGREFGSVSTDFPNNEFQTMQEWIDHAIANNNWGKPDRWVLDRDEDVSEAIGTRPFGDDDDGILEYHLPSDYSIEENDITQEWKDIRGANRAGKNIDVCRQVITKISYFNERFASDSSVMALFQSIDFLGIIGALTTGGIPQARQMISIIGPSVYPQQFVDSILSDLDVRIAEIAAEKAVEAAE